MGLKEELGLDRPIKTIEHECLLNIVYTGTIFSKLSYKFFSKSDITDAQFNVLMQLKYAKNKKLSQVDLSKRLFVNRADVTGLIDRLEKGGFVKRGSHSTDRRVNLLTITSTGLELLERLEPEYFKEVNKIFSSFGEKKIKDLINNLEKVRQQIVK
ncbi:MAG: MarR family transcriptional regulator [Elusimicrobia bacterium]|nr:MarR family transcriptional regulator [Elusimicrobiota bacterium]